MYILLFSEKKKSIAKSRLTLYWASFFFSFFYVLSSRYFPLVHLDAIPVGILVKVNVIKFYFIQSSFRPILLFYIQYLDDILITQM